VRRDLRPDPGDPALRRRLRRTAWTLFAVMAALAAGSACFIALYGRKSHTVLHSERTAAERPSTDRG
jgi:hypothetical protein